MFVHIYKSASVAFDKSSRLKMFIVKYEMNFCVIFKLISRLNG